MQYLEAQKRVCRKLDISYDSIAYNGLISLDDIKDALTSQTRVAWDYKSWSFKEAHKKATTIADQEQYDYPSDVQPESIYYLSVAGSKPYEKLRFPDYRKYLIDNSGTKDKIFCEYNHFIFVNPASFSGNEEMDILGKTMCPVLSGATDNMPFSPDVDAETMQYSGNDAIVLLAAADLTESKLRNPNLANNMRNNAWKMLNQNWTQMGKDRATEQSSNSPLFNVPDYFPQNSGRFVPGNFS